MYVNFQNSRPPYLQYHFSIFVLSPSGTSIRHMLDLISAPVTQVFFHNFNFFLSECYNLGNFFGSIFLFINFPFSYFYIPLFVF